MEMKICYIGNAKSIHVKRWTKWFAERGHEVHLITDRPDNIEGVKIHTVRFGRNPITFLIEALQVKNLVKKINPDILHAHYITSYGFFGAFANHHPFVVTGWGADILIEPYRIPLIKYLAKYVLKKADYVTVFSGFLLKNIYGITKNIKNIDIITPWRVEDYTKYSGDDTTKLIKKFRKELKIQNHSFVVLSPRNMQPVYRIDKIIKAVPAVVKNYPKTLFIFLKGDADENYYQKNKELIHKLSLDKNVRIVEKWLNEKEMAAIYKLSDIVISIPEKDQFSGVVRESMIYGVVPVISDLPIYKELLKEGENAFFVSGKSSSEIAYKIIYCIENPDILKKIKDKNKKLIMRYDKSEGKLDKMEKICEKLINYRKEEYDKYENTAI